tara:strand:+ start:705 stop:914 length:210 start_codon:yes stop_codon:yes gene_type:complete
MELILSIGIYSVVGFIALGMTYGIVQLLNGFFKFIDEMGSGLNGSSQTVYMIILSIIVGFLIIGLLGGL